jgi:hypothetical protein
MVETKSHLLQVTREYSSLPKYNRRIQQLVLLGEHVFVVDHRRFRVSIPLLNEISNVHLISLKKFTKNETFLGRFLTG